MKTSRQNQLINITHRFETLAHNDPIVLRHLIPAQEMWRFFVDGNMQKHGRNLHLVKIFKKETFLKRIKFWSVNKFKLSVENYIETIENLDLEDEISLLHSHIYRSLQYHMGIPQNLNIFQCTLKEILKLDRAWLSFEANEPGCLKAFIAAMDVVFNYQEELTFSFIEKLHNTVTRGVLFIDQEERKTSRKEKLAFRFMNTSTVAGFKLFLDSLASKNTHRNLSLEISYETKCLFLLDQYSLQHLKLFWSTTELVTNQNLVNIFDKCLWTHKSYLVSQAYAVKLEFLRKMIDLKNFDSLAAQIHEWANSEDLKATVTFMSFDDGSIITVLQSLIEEFNYKMSHKNEKLDRLNEIVTFIQICEQLHPFNDGNCRTFCVLLLNFLLLREGFPLTILDNPNCFDMFDPDTLVQEVINGMERCLNLLAGENLYSLKTSKVIKFLESKSVFEGPYQYFQEAVAMENGFRSANLKKPQVPNLTQFNFFQDKGNGTPSNNALNDQNRSQYKKEQRACI